MEPKYKIVTKNDFSRLGRFCDFDEVFEKLAEMGIDAGFHVVEVDSGKDVTGEFKECMAEGGFVFAEELEKEINGRLMEIMSKKTYKGYNYEGRAGEIIALRAYQYVSHFQDEEKLMRSANFEGLPHHKAEHDAFRNKIIDMPCRTTRRQ